MLDHVEKETFQELADRLKKLSVKKKIQALKDGYAGASLRDMMEHFRRSIGQKHKRLGEGTYGTVYEGDDKTNTVYKLFPSTEGYLSWVYFIVTSRHDLSPNAQRFLPIVHKIQLVSDGVHPANRWKSALNSEYNAHVVLVELERLEEFQDSEIEGKLLKHNRSAMRYFVDGEPSTRIRHNKTMRALKEIYDHPQCPSMNDMCERNAMLRISKDKKQTQLVINDPCASWTDYQERIDKVERLVA